MRLNTAHLLPALAFSLSLLIAGTATAQVAAGGGGEPRPDQYFTVAPEFATERFSPQAKLSATERKDRDEAWRKEIRKQLFVPDSLPTLNARVHSTFSPMPGVLADRVTYDTADGMMVTAIVYRPDPKSTHATGKLPGIVVVNGHGGDKFSWYAFYSGLLYARAGAVVVTYDPIGEGERNSQRGSRITPSEHDLAVDMPHWGQRLTGLTLTDIQQAVSYLRSLPEVDPSRIATVGYSTGAFLSGINGAIDSRIHAVVLSGGGTWDGPHEYFDNGKLPCQAPSYRSLGVIGDRTAIIYALNAARGPMYVMNGDGDTVMRMAEHPPTWFEAAHSRAAALLGDDASARANLFTTVLYPGISHRTSWVDLDGTLWLNQQIHFAFWDERAIRAAGTTHVSDWIKANNVDISKNYIREDREGGIDAVGTGFPAIKRDDLMVLTPSEWQAEKPRLLYAAWAAKAIIAEEAANKPAK